ncbi:uncharacterized mitochondrial protein AtMg00810-like [Solanum dulcamara]|uniref:uncharacterized mitochondrial protein AtMg00810-like n=1 Tax=Solanum dulcamara TaxID=45834 RepID=UPI0024855228|nr:uncharacterized mitochondrial protein AtMg00810-like [Solanum dulcamara]
METVYMYQPLGYRDPDRPNHVCLLQKSLYGLKQALGAWNERFADYVHTLEFSYNKTDHSLLIYHRDSFIAYFLLYVDDIILTASSDELRQSIISLLSSEFSMKDLAEIIDCASMTSCKPSPTPVDTKPKLRATISTPFADPSLYRSLAGVCLFMHDPWDEHMNALKRIMRYLQGTLDYGLHLYPSSTTTFVSYNDVDWGGCPDTRRSASGYCVFMGDNLISWSAKRQATLSRSSVKAEYRGISNVIFESCWLRNLLLELHCPIPWATLVYCDNVSAIYLVGNPSQTNAYWLCLRSAFVFVIISYSQSAGLIQLDSCFVR